MSTSHSGSCLELPQARLRALQSYRASLDQLAVSGAPSQPSQWVSGDSTCGDSVLSELEQAQLSKFPPALVTLQVGADDIDFGACLTWALTEPIPIPGGQKCVDGSDPTNFSDPE